MATPPGWPKDLCDPDDPSFPGKVVGWLLDRCPPEYRNHEVFRRHPVVLAHVALHASVGARDGARAAYSGIRRDLGEVATPETIEASLRAVEKLGAHLVAAVREVELVAEALKGQRWTLKM